jgi:DNA-binding CsgD family transcriptional regulator
MIGSELLAWHKNNGRWAELAAHATDQRTPVARPRLSPREQKCLTRLAVALRHDRTAEKLSISRPTVE